MKIEESGEALFDSDLAEHEYAEAQRASRTERLKSSIAEQLTQFLLLEDKDPLEVQVMVVYPGTRAKLNIKIES